MADDGGRTAVGGGENAEYAGSVGDGDSTGAEN